MTKKTIIYYTLREAFGLIVMGVALFWSSGAIEWWPAWAALGVMLGWMISMALVIFLTNPELINKRLEPQKGAKRWDTKIVPLISLLQLMKYIIAGLDHRYNWTNDFPISIRLMSLTLCICGYSVFTWAAYSNKSFSHIVYIDPKSKQAVAKDGPYRYIRHPSYLGAIVYEVAVSILLSSIYSLIVGIVTIGLFILRTIMEDNSLLNELKTYKEYSKQVKYRLVPRIW